MNHDPFQPRLLTGDMMPPIVGRSIPREPLVPIERVQQKRTIETLHMTPLDALIEQAAYTIEFLEDAQETLTREIEIADTQIHHYEIHTYTGFDDLAHSRAVRANCAVTLRNLKSALMTVRPVVRLYANDGVGNHNIFRHLLAMIAEGKLDRRMTGRKEKNRRDIRRTILLAIKSMPDPLAPFRMHDLVRRVRSIDITLQRTDIKQAVATMDGTTLRYVSWGKRQLTSAHHIDDLPTYAYAD